CDDREPVEDLLKNFQGTLFGDKGYLSKDLFLKLYKKGIKFVTGLKKGMKNVLIPKPQKIADSNFLGFKDWQQF
ncbi:MAG: transposase, partial [Holosporales bacterium]|nr:transposase [Holosporales bacterium]